MIGAKYFHSYYTNEIDKEINEWLMENQDIKIEFIKVEAVQSNICVFIVYKKGGKL